ncbi:MAG: sugar ABC transporter substrate-binding protein [Clostridiales bacterium]|jgi:multiple sugar transport system substrate-binding protein|nr:sugar ABC transporter substrate-binding protein [Clostridiales bacterium]
MKKLIALLCAAAIAMSLGACSSGGNAANLPASVSGQTTANNGGEAATTDEKTPVTINFDQFSGSGDNETYLKQMIDLYTAANPHVTVKLQSYGYDDYFKQLSAKVAAGKAPDVFELNYENFAAYAGNGSLSTIDGMGVDTSVYNQMALQAFSFSGVQYGVPNSFSNVVLIYNKDLFDQAGEAYPTDDWKWEDAMSAAEKIRALDDNIFGYYHSLSFSEFYKTVAQNGGSFLSVDGKAFAFNSPQNLETLTYMVDMQTKTNVMPTAAQLGAMGDWDLFKSGRLGMIVTGIWAFPDFTRDCDFAWDVEVEPGHTQKATHFFSNGYVIAKDTSIAEEAAQFITFISSNRQATQIRLDAAWELPPINDEEIVSQYKAQTPPANREAVFKSLDYLVTPPVITQFVELQDIVGRNLLDCANGLVTPQQCLDKMQEECSSSIDLTAGGTS